jgi:hypothetical protein
VREPLPSSVAYLWDWFREISAGRAPAAGGLAAAPITCTEIEAWQRLTRVQLTAWEFDTVRSMDRAAVAAFAALPRAKG